MVASIVEAEMQAKLVIAGRLLHQSPMLFEKPDLEAQRQHA
jgi:hypothetical protein